MSARGERVGGVRERCQPCQASATSLNTPQARTSRALHCRHHVARSVCRASNMVVQAVIQYRVQQAFVVTGHRCLTTWPAARHHQHAPGPPNAASGDDHRHGRTDAGFALQFDTPAEAIAQSTDDRQAKPSALRAGRVGAEERFETRVPALLRSCQCQYRGPRYGRGSPRPRCCRYRCKRRHYATDC